MEKPAVHPLRAYREAHSPPLSQSELAADLGVGLPTLCRYENGTRQIGPSKLGLISRKTGIPVRELRPDLAELIAEGVQ